MARPRRQRGYVLVTVIVLGVVLASLSTILLIATNRDQSEANQQARTVRAMYAAEGAVAIGMDLVEQKLAGTTATSLFLGADVANPTDTTKESTLEADARKAAAKAMPYAVIDSGKLSIRFYDAATNTVSNKLVGSTATVQVLATAMVENATATVADAMAITVSSRFFNHAVFADGDLEMDAPTPTVVIGAAHANGDIWLSNSGSDRVNFVGAVTSAKSIKSVAAYAKAVAVLGVTGTTTKAAATQTVFLNPDKSALAGVDTDLPKKLDPYTGAATSGSEDQATYLKRVFGDNVKDSSAKATAVSVPLESLASPGKIISRPDKCSDGVTAAAYAQEPAIALIKRPAKAYQGDPGSSGIYDYTGKDLKKTDYYTADFGLRSALSGGSDEDPAAVKAVNPYEVEVARHVPLLDTIKKTDDELGENADQRLFWKATIRIIDGVWYRGSDGAVIFDPENVDYTKTAPSETDTNHEFARVLRYSWWWDMRESRVYCTTAGDPNCVTDSLPYHRGLQIRATDFDAAAFMALLEDSAARKLMFGSDTVPSTGIVVYMSETYDPKLEDANTSLPRAANVRNFLNFPIMSNMLAKTGAAGTDSVAQDPKTFKLAIAPSMTRKAPNRAATTAIPTPFELGWFPEMIWGKHAPAGFNSLTQAYLAGVAQSKLATDLATAALGYADPSYQTRVPPSSTTADSKILGATTSSTVSAMDLCQTRQRFSDKESLSPNGRPSTFTKPAFVPPCIQAGATPLGAENAIRLVRAASLPKEGFTFATDNRLYILGNVGVDLKDTTKASVGAALSSGSTKFTAIDLDQDAATAGKISIWADSVTVLSDRFDERERQIVANNTLFDGYFFDHQKVAFTSKTPKIAPFVQNSTTVPRIGNAPSDYCTTSWGMRLSKAVTTRINASVVAGDVPDCTNAGNSIGNSSGGINNLLRLAEDWTGSALVVNGTLMNLYHSERGNARYLPPGGNDGGGAMSTVARSKQPYWAISTSQTCVFVRPDALYLSYDSKLTTTEPPGLPSGGTATTNRVRWVRR